MLSTTLICCLSLNVLVNVCYGTNDVENKTFKKYDIQNVKMNNNANVTSVKTRVGCVLICQQTQNCVCVSFNTQDTHNNCELSNNIPLNDDTLSSIQGWSIYYQENWCSNDWQSSGNSCYKLQSVTHTYSEAKTLCESYQGGHLVDISSANEQTFVADLVEDQYPSGNTLNIHVWIGLNDIQVEGTFRWSDGSALAGFNKWNSNQPDNGLFGSGTDQDCVILWQTGNFKWHDYPCTENAMSVCEIDMM